MTPGTPATLRVRVPDEAATGSITGKVAENHSREVELFVSGPSCRVRRGTVSADGTSVVGHLPAGRYRISAVAGRDDAKTDPTALTGVEVEVLAGGVSNAGTVPGPD